MSSIFVSYRRQDAASEAGRIYERLVRGFGSDGVFRDKDSTSAGADFVHVIQRTIAMCDVLLVVIGPRWLQTRDGVSRLDDPRDWVRIEILSALERNILVIPILVDGATMPSEADLPEKLRPLARRQAAPLTETGWKGVAARTTPSSGGAPRGPGRRRVRTSSWKTELDEERKRSATRSRYQEQTAWSRSSARRLAGDRCGRSAC